MGRHVDVDLDRLRHSSHVTGAATMKSRKPGRACYAATQPSPRLTMKRIKESRATPLMRTFLVNAAITIVIGLGIAAGTTFTLENPAVMTHTMTHTVAGIHTTTS
jgi:hypothetical protein